MDDSAENLLEKLETHIISCNDAVTYKWLSKEWNLHVNAAKQLLYLFVKEHSSKNDPVNLEVIYYISGLLKNGDITYQVSLVREKDLPDVKTKFKVIHSEHIYSVQNSPLKDLHDLYVIDKVNAVDIIQGKGCKGSIKCEEAVPRTAEYLAKLILSSKVPIINPSKSGPSVDKKSSDVTKTKQDEPKKEEAKVADSKVKKDEKKGIAGMFAAQSVKNAAKKPDEIGNENGGNSKNIIQKPHQKNHLANLFAKQAERPPVQKTKKEEPRKKVDPPKEVYEEEDPFASEDEEDFHKDIVKDDRKKTSIDSVHDGKANSRKKKDKKNKKKRESSAGDEEDPLPTKKRRRIRMMSSESSSDEEMEFGDSESPINESPIPDSPKKKSNIKDISDDDDDIIPATPCEAQGLGSKIRKRKRTLVNRTFLDEKGYVVTKKEYVFVSCSEDSSQSGDETKAKESKSKDSSNHVDETASSKTAEQEKKSSLSNGKGTNSPEEKEKGKKNKEAEKGKKNSKKVTPVNVRQGILTNFFKRS